KSVSQYQIGGLFEFESKKSKDLVIGVIGTGLLGSQIANYILEYGYKIVLKTRSEEQKLLISDQIRKRISKKLTDSQVNKCLQKLHTTTDYSDLSECSIIIEASAEDIDIKKRIFRELSTACTDECILATNTSSLSIDVLGEASDRPDKVIGMHFFNPVHKMDLVEIVLGENTSQTTKDLIVTLAIDLNKSPILVKNSPGFIVNRYLLPQINEAIRMLEEGVSSKEDIDSAIKLGLNHPMGPLELADFIGLDICLSILEVLAEGFGSERFKPTKLLSEMVNEGKLGVKSGEGFYKY
ncbi:MAG: 3-hydroxyacyl-CoA dehydrogenase NAD-binding domain-containing protein, partial [Methanobacterium sp.]